MMQIVEKENEIIRQMKKTKSEGGKVYCLGASHIGYIVKKIAALHGVIIDAFLISKKNYDREEHTLDGIPVLCMEDTAKKDIFSSKDLLVVAFRDCDNGVINRYRKQLNICKEDTFSLWSVNAADGEGVLDYDFLSEHKEEFETLYRSLADDKSRVCMDAYLNQRISGKFLYLDKIYDDEQYWDNDIVDFITIESIVDCGAFVGDSYLAFREAYRMNTGKEYEGIAYLLEPNATNYEKMTANCSHAGGDNRFLLCGAWNERSKLYFEAYSDGSSSRVTEVGALSIDVNSIDNIVKGQRVDFIKMDIEGAELNALKGARKTIETYKPILAICVYHKNDDLLTIPAYLRSICPEYHLYLRIYSRYSQELVLYAVCG